MATLLHIYDAEDMMIRAGALVRWGWNMDIHRVPIYGGQEALKVALDELVADGKEYTHALFETHGNSGVIFFNGQALNAEKLRTTYTGMGYEKIFPFWNTRIYFNGCNVADDPNGWEFLDAAGRIFLQKGGGVTFAATELGRMILLTGHIYHIGSRTSYSVFLPGGHLWGHVND